MSIYTVVSSAKEEYGSVSEQYTPKSAQCSVTLRVPWSDRYNVVNDLINNQYEWPQVDNEAFVSSVAVRPVLTKYTESDGAIIYEEALITVQYSTDDAQVRDESGNRFSESIEPHSEFITLDHKRFRWGSASGEPLEENEAPGRIVRGFSLVRTLYAVPSISSTILSLPGCVNNAQYISAVLGLTFPAETLMFGDPVISRTVVLGGSSSWDVTLRFSFKPDGWNKFWRSQSQAYEQIYDVQGSAVYKNYPLANFSAFLF